MKPVDVLFKIKELNEKMNELEQSDSDEKFAKLNSELKETFNCIDENVPLYKSFMETETEVVSAHDGMIQSLSLKKKRISSFKNLRFYI